MNGDTEELRALLAAQPAPDCAALTPFTVAGADFAAGAVTLAFAAQPAFRNHFGHIQGGFAVAMLDAAISIAAYAKTRIWAPTVEIKTSFLEPVPIGPCVGEGRVVKAGRSLVFLEGRLLTPDGRAAIIAMATALLPSRG